MAAEFRINHHPIYRMPTRQEAERLGPEKSRDWVVKASQLIQLERDDPFKHGHEPNIWHLCDDLLCDGHKVVLDLTRVAEISPGGKPPQGFVPTEIAGASEIWIAGGNRSGKSEFAAKKVMKILVNQDGARTWSFADTSSTSIARQQPIFFKYLPAEIKKEMAGSGKLKYGVAANVVFRQKTGFSDESFVLPNSSQHWFRNYAQLDSSYGGGTEGDQLDAIWLDELRNLDLLRTLRGRMIDRGGILVVTFTAISESFSPVVHEYNRGARTVLEVDAELLPIKRPKITVQTTSSNGNTAHDNGQWEIAGYEKVPRLKVAGPGIDGNLRANIVYFHISDNAYFGYDGATRRAGAQEPLIGAERFLRVYRGASPDRIRARVYGIMPTSSAVMFPKFSDAVHVVGPDQIPRAGTNYHFVDPCEARLWAMVWIRIDLAGRWYVYREFPSTGHPGAYIPGIGDPGPWTVSGGAAADGKRGPAQESRGFGIDRYVREIRRLEGRLEEEQEVERPMVVRLPRRWSPGVTQEPSEKGEIIQERFMDSRYGAAPTRTQEGTTTLVEQMADAGMDFLAASGKNISEGIAMVNNLLDFDFELELGRFSAQLGRLNAPKLYVSRNCPNLIYALREYTGKDGMKGACKDFVDLLRYAALAELGYIGEDAYAWRGGGSY